MHRRYRYILVLVLLLSLGAAAKLPPRVEAIYPESGKSFRADSEIWLYGPTLGSLDREKIEFIEGSSGAVVELEIEELPCSDFSSYAFGVDWSDGRVGDHGELELLVVRPKATLNVGVSYELETEFIRQTYKIAEFSEAAPLPKLQIRSAAARSEGGRDFNGAAVHRLDIEFSPVPSIPGTPVRIEIADAASEQPFGFVIAKPQQTHLATLAGPAQIKLRLADGLGRKGEWSEPVPVSKTGFSWKITGGVIAIILFLLGVQRFRK